MTTNTRMITLRVQVNIPVNAKRPQRVRVVLKERGALFFPFQRKVASIPLYKAKWRPWLGNVWQNEQAMAVPLNVAKLLKRDRLALQLYCLRGSSVKHKAIGSFQRLMKQLHNDELLLTMHYPKCDLQERHVGKGKVQDGSRVKHSGGEASSAGVHTLARKAASTSHNVVTGSAVPTNMLPQDCARMTLPVPTCHELDSKLSLSTASTALDPSPRQPSSALPLCSATSTLRQAGLDSRASVTAEVTATPPPRRVRFTESDSVFSELLRQYDLHAAETKAREEAEHKAKEKARPQPWRELMWMNLLGAHMMPPLLLRHVVLDLHRDGIPRLCGDASLPVQAVLWAWTGVTLCLYYASSWAPAGWVRKAEAATSSHRRCHKCRLDVPRQAHHCDVCEVCVLDRHYHSYLTGSCVGRGNVRTYRLLCVVGAVGGLACAAVVGGGALLFGQDVLPKDWMVGGMAVALMLAGVGAHASVSRTRRGREARSREASPSESELP